MIRLDRVEQLLTRVSEKLAGRVGERDRCLLHLCAEFGEGEDAQTITGNTDESFGAQLGREAEGVVESVENERSELEHVLVGVVEP